MNTLYTPFEKDLGEIPWNEYPRPQLKRDSFICLNGKWDIKILRKTDIVKTGEALVPFPLEARLSGFEFERNPKDVMVYSRKFTLEDIDESKRVILHFGAVDQECTVFVNRQIATTNIGGYLPFSADITPFISAGENSLVVVVKDSLDTDLAHGKQRYKRGGMWYTPTSGIWGTVWLEIVPENYIKNIKITPDLKGFDLEVFGGESKKTISIQGREIKFSGEKVRIDIENPKLWSPDSPTLYDFTLISGEDKIESYAALRTIEVKGNKILFNGKPQFFHGLLDQGYFSDGIYLAATPEGFKNDILKMKELGFNTLRKHIKIEPELFYYYCDKYGIFIFQDFVNSGKYSFLIDTALPTVLCKKGISHRASQKRRLAFLQDGNKTVKHLYNHPSVCYYTIFNEGWGQFDAVNIYEKFKSFDPSRVWDATSGWFQTSKSDVNSLHIYFKPLKFGPDSRPLVLSEFGGYSYKVEGHSFNDDKTYAYKFFKTRKEFETGLVNLYNNEVIPAIENNGLCATILTQVSDVEDETNGLLTYDRQVLKVEKDAMLKISEGLYKAFKLANNK